MPFPCIAHACTLVSCLYRTTFQALNSWSFFQIHFALQHWVTGERVTKCLKFEQVDFDPIFAKYLVALEKYQEDNAAKCALLQLEFCTNGK
jgi:hypothetical protein